MRGHLNIGSALAEFIEPQGTESVDPVGVPYRVHYWMLAAFAFGVAIGPIAFALEPGGGELRNPVTLSLCAGGLLFAPFIVFVGRRTGFIFKDWIFQGALFFALFGTFISNLVTPHMIAPFMTLYILAPVGAALFLPARKAIPVAAVSAAAAIMYMSTRVDEPNAMLRGMILTIVAVTVAQVAAEMKRELGRAVEQNREIAERDPLTGAHNLRRFETRLTEEIARARRGGSGFVLAMFDLDNFKQVNDVYNHSTGDEVLVATATAIASALQPSDLLVRRGGDEFAVVLPFAPGRHPGAVVELARERIERARREICPELTPFGSAGWVAYEAPETADDLVARADAALHEAKQLAPERRGHRPQLSTRQVARNARRSVPATAARHPRHETGSIDDDPIRALITVQWRSGVRVIIAASLTIGAMSAAGKTTIDFSSSRLLLFAAWLLVFMPATLWAGTRERRPAWVKYLLAVAALALLTVVCAVAGGGATALVDLYLITALLFTALLPTRHAAMYLLFSMGCYGVFLYANHYPYAEIRLSVATMNVSLAALILAITRHRTISAARDKARLARTDALTGLPNLRRLRDRLDDEIRRCGVTGDGLALLMLDLDDFKSVNDRHGHWLGDDTLVAVADAIQSVCRHADMPARRGGDEFAVVMTDAGKREAVLAAERVAGAIRAARLDAAPGINPNASVGWVAWRPGESAAELIDRADNALHAVKTRSHDVQLRTDAI